MNKVYRITAVTPEDGRITYDTLDETVARRVHSNLMMRQLSADDFTHDVRIERVTK